MNDEGATVEGTRRPSALRRALLALRSRRVRHRRVGLIRPSARRALAEFRRELDALPETAHPIGL